MPPDRDEPRPHGAAPVGSGTASAAGSPNLAESVSPAPALSAASAGSPAPDSPRSSSPKSLPMDSKPSLLPPLDSKLSMAASTDGSEVSGSGSGSGSGSIYLSPQHYDAANDVVLRLEFLRTQEVKTILRTVRASVVAGLVILLISLIMKVTKDESHYLTEDTVPTVNLVFAAPLCAAMLACWLIFFYRVYRSNLSHKRWSHRRRRAVTLAGTELTLQLVNLVFFIVPNVHVLSNDCAWFDPIILWAGFVRWSIWNTLFLMFWIQAHSANPARTPYWRQHTDRPDAAIMDAPLRSHWRKLWLWALQEGVLLAITIVSQAHPDDLANGMTIDPTITDCRRQGWSCKFATPTLVLMCLNVANLSIYWLLYIFFISRAINNLKNLPYNAMRMANLTVRMQVRLRALSILFFLVCVICFTFVNLNSCNSYILSWLGYLPMQLVMTATAIANGYMCMPKRPHEAGILQVWLQEFCWTEAEVPRKRAERGSSLPPCAPEGPCLQREPIFCFETAVKCMFWSFLVYDYGERRRSAEAEEAQVQAALATWDLEHFECFWEKSLDTKAVVGWSEDTVVIAFRGTASMANVKADLQAWRTRWPASIGSPLLCTAPMVHSGFLCCYTANGFHERLLSRLEHILYRCSHTEQGARRPVTVHVTGHSLGGAMAALCAYDIKKRCPCAEGYVNVKCYAFGAPRPGNKAFAQTFDAAVPDCWQLVNSDDVVTRAGKFGVLYTRIGHKVLLNRLGDLLVRPNYVETQIRGVPGGASVKDHLLTSYQKAVVAVVAAQFGKKSLKEGREGVRSLAQQKGMLRVLQSAGLSQREMRLLEEHGWEAWRSLRQSTRKQRSRRRRGSGSGSGEAVAAAAAAAAELIEAEEGQTLQAVVVEPAGPPEQMEAGEGSGDGQQQQQGGLAHAAGETGAEAAAAAGAAAQPDLEAGGTVEQHKTEERDGVLHMTQMHCRPRCGRRCRTICALLGKQPRTAGEAATPMADAPAAEQQQQDGRQQQQQQQQQQVDQTPLQAIAEAGEEGEEVSAGKASSKEGAPSPPQSPSPPESPHSSLPASPHGAQQRRHSPWWQPLATAVGWDRLPSLRRTLSSASSLGSTAPSSPGAFDGGTRGSTHDALVMPLVLDWAGSGRPDSPESLSSGPTLQEHSTGVHFAEPVAAAGTAGVAAPAAADGVQGVP